MREYDRVRRRFWGKGIFLGVIIVSVGIFLGYGNIPSGESLWGVLEIFARGDTHDAAQLSLRESKIQGALAALEDAWPGVQARALSALDELDAVDRIPQSAIPRIALLLKHSDNDARLIAIETLAAVSAKENLPQIAAFLVYDDADIRAAAVAAVGKMGVGQEDIYLSQALMLLHDRERQVQRAAVKALRQLDRTGESYLPQLIESLDHEDTHVWIETLVLLGMLREEVVPFVPRLEALLDDKEPEVRATAVDTLGKLGSYAESAIPHMAVLLQDTSPQVRVAAIRSLSRMPSLEDPYRQQIVELLKEEQPGEVRATVIEALGELEDDIQISLPLYVEHLTDQEAQVQVAAIEMLGASGTQAEPYIPQLTALLEHDNWEVRATAVEALGRLGDIAKPAIPRIVVLCNDEDWFVRSHAIRAVGAFVRPDDSALSQLLGLLDDDDGNVRASVTWVLGNLGQEARPYESRLFTLLEDPHSGVRYAAARALKNLGDTKLESLPAIAALISSDSSRTAELRFLAHSMGAGSSEVEMFLQWFGNPGKNTPALESLSPDQAKSLLGVFDAVWEAAASFNDMRVQMADVVGEVAGQTDIEWQKNDLPLLKSLVSHLEPFASPHVKPLQSVVTALTIQSILRSPFLLILLLCLLHPLMWLGLLLVYPVSPHIRTIFFWNPYVRKIVGLGYIQVALINLSLLRQRLFEPFRRSLLSDAALGDFDDSMYFKDSEVYAEHTQVMLSAHEAIPEIRGKIVLEGESGIGKTMFARYLLKYATCPVVYLPAEKCRDGIIAAIQPKFRGEAKDTEFLRSLVCAGGLDICIDGLDAISAKNRLCVTRFLTHAFKGNVLVTTQATDWTPPSLFKTYVMQPLDYGRIEEFLISCYRILPEDVPVSHSEYTLACKNYLARVLDENVPLDMVASTQQILAIPINLTMIALLEAYGQEPDFPRLPEQCYHLVDEEYQRMNQGQPFQLVQFSERVYRMRLNDEATIPHRRFSREIACMARYKMVLSHPSFDVYGNPTTEWYFRHDKIMEFFIAEAFLSGNNHRTERHLEDSRFQGVYTLLYLAGLLGNPGYKSTLELDADYPNVIKLADVI